MSDQKIHKLTLTIATLEKEIFSGEADQVSIPTVEGEITVLPHHLPLVVALAEGRVRATIGDEEVSMAVYGGVAEVSGNAVVLLADTAELAEHITETEILKNKARLEKLLDRHPKDSREYVALSRRLEGELTKLRFINKT